VLEHTLFGMVRDAPVLKMGHLVPLEKFVWGSDFPHSVGTFPTSNQQVKEMFEGMDEGLKRKILVETICGHLSLDPNADITETPQS
jgi:predicted TIM-barrel fold metal-dependent hydrolase